MDTKIDPKILKREKLRRYGVIMAVVIVIIIAVAISLSLLRKEIAENSLTFGLAEVGELETTIPASGRVVPSFEEIVNSPVNSRVLRVSVHPGDTVAIGTPLIELDLESVSTDFGKMSDRYNIHLKELEQLKLQGKMQLNELAMKLKIKQIELDGLKIDVENERLLDSIGSGTGERVRQAETALRGAEIELDQLRTRLQDERERITAGERVKELEIMSYQRDMAMMERTLNQGKVPAPYSGVVTFIINEIGKQVSVGEKLAVVSDLSQFDIEGEVAEGNLRKIMNGASVRARIGTAELPGHISKIMPQAQNGMATFNVVLNDPQNQLLRPGMRVELYISYGFKDNIIRLPNGAYYKGPGECSLFVDNGKGELERRKVILGESSRDYVEIKEGIKAGERVVLSDLDDLRSHSSLKLK